MGSSRLEQTDALFRKNLVIQVTPPWSSSCFGLFPIKVASFKLLRRMDEIYPFVIRSSTDRIWCSCIYDIPRSNFAFKSQHRWKFPALMLVWVSTRFESAVPWTEHQGQSSSWYWISIRFTPNPQRRACKTNCCLIMFPLLLCSVIGGLQIAINRASSRGEGGASATPATHLDCSCSNVSVDENAMGGIQCPPECPLPRAPRWPPVLNIPSPEYRAVQDGLFPFTDLPDASCRVNGSCAATFLVTGANHSFVESKFFCCWLVHSDTVQCSASFLLVVSEIAFYPCRCDG